MNMNIPLLLVGLLLAGERAPQSVVVVVGAYGAPEYGAEFSRWADAWAKAAERAGARCVRIGRGDGARVDDRDRLREVLATESRSSDDALWLVLIGHGTFDGRQAKLNLRGPDVSAAELAEWLEPVRRPLAVVNCASSSGPFINRLSAPGRVVVTATKSGFEYNYARFGGHLASGIADPRADLDKDGQTSILEAFIAASAQTAEFYRQEGRLATEHALLDDNGDGLGTPSGWYRGIRATRRAKDGASPDGLRAHQFHLIRSPRDRDMPPRVRARRDELELAIARLREAKGEAGEDEYYTRLEPVVLELARLYESLETKERSPDR